MIQTRLDESTMVLPPTSKGDKKNQNTMLFHLLQNCQSTWLAGTKQHRLPSTKRAV
jgi:hypothetical protein